MRSVRNLLVYVGVLVALGCGEERSLAPAVQQAGRSLTRVTYEPRQQERAFEALSLAAKSSAGFFYDEAGIMRIYLVDTAESDVARQAARSLVATRLVAAADGGFHVPEVQIIKGQYRFDQLAGWRDIVSKSMLGKFGVVGSDLDERANRVKVAVLQSRAAEAIAFVEDGARAAGIPLAALRIVIEPPLQLDDINCSPEETGTIESRWRPLKGGLQIRWMNSTSCATLGFLATVGSTRYAVTNSHNTGTLFRSLEHLECSPKAIARHLESEPSRSILAAGWRVG